MYTGEELVCLTNDVDLSLYVSTPFLSFSHTLLILKFGP